MITAPTDPPSISPAANSIMTAFEAGSMPPASGSNAAIPRRRIVGTRQFSDGATNVYGAHPYADARARPHAAAARSNMAHVRRIEVR